MAMQANPLRDFDLAGQVALVTGTGRGIGAAVAAALARAGAEVIVNDRDPETAQRTAQRINANGGTSIYLRADVGSESEVEGLFQVAAQWRSRLHILVCNAGVTNTSDIFSVTTEEWEAVLRTNLTGPFLCARRAMQLMRDQGTGGRIIFIGSGVVHQGALMGHVAYASSKGGVHALARTLARTGAPMQITVNVIAPGLTDTQLLHETHVNSQIESVAATVPLGIGLPEDIGAATVYLASRAAQHITGITLDVANNPVGSLLNTENQDGCHPHEVCRAGILFLRSGMTSTPSNHQPAHDDSLTN